MSNSKQMILQPLFDRAFIEFETDPDAPLDDSQTGDIVVPRDFRPALPEGAGFPYHVATVLGAGPDCKHLQAGCRIVVARNNVEKFSVAGRTFWQISEKGCAGIIAP